MEGFIHHHMNVWLRRLITMVPSLIVIGLGMDPLQILVLVAGQPVLPAALRHDPAGAVHQQSKDHGRIYQPAPDQDPGLAGTLVILALNAVLLYQIFLGGK